MPGFLGKLRQRCLAWWQFNIARNPQSAPDTLFRFSSCCSCLYRRYGYSAQIALGHEIEEQRKANGRLECGVWKYTPVGWEMNDQNVFDVNQSKWNQSVWSTNIQQPNQTSHPLRSSLAHYTLLVCLVYCTCSYYHKRFNHQLEHHRCFKQIPHKQFVCEWADVLRVRVYVCIMCCFWGDLGWWQEHTLHKILKG
jgi:hypothetical protein